MPVPETDSRATRWKHLFRPGDPLALELTWPAGALDGRTFTAALDGEELEVDVAGDVMTITGTEEQTTAAGVGSASFVLADQDRDVLVGPWHGSMSGAVSVDTSATIVIEDVTMTVEVLGGVTSLQLAAAVQAAVDDLLDGAPGALDTLNELAAALGDDASFAATVATSLAGKAAVDASNITAATWRTALSVYSQAQVDAADAAEAATRAAADTALDGRLDTAESTLAALPGTYVSHVAAPSGDATGVTDTAVIQAALDAAEAAGGGRVIIQEGTYYASGLRIGSRVKLDGPGTIRRPSGVVQNVVASKTWTTTGTIAAAGTSLTVASAANIERHSVIGIFAGQASTEQLTTLSAGIDASVTTIPVTAVTGFAPSGHLWIENECISYASVVGSELQGCVRGKFGTTAAAHLSGVDVAYALYHYAIVTAVSGTTVTIDEACPKGVTSATVEVGAIGPEVCGITIDGAKPQGLSSLFGVIFRLARRGSVVGCKVHNVNHIGIMLTDACRNNLVALNHLHDCGTPTSALGGGIWLFGRSCRNIVTANEITGDCWVGVYLDDRTTAPTPYDGACEENSVTNNVIDTNREGLNLGIIVVGGNRNKINDNIIRGPRTGLNIQNSLSGIVPLVSYHNEFMNNTVLKAEVGVLTQNGGGTENRVWFTTFGPAVVTPISELAGTNNDFLHNTTKPGAALLAADAIVRGRVVGDTQHRVILTAGGELLIGTGAGATDNRIWRAGVAILGVDGEVRAHVAGSSSSGFGIRVSGFGALSMSLKPNQILMGGGTAAQDCLIERTGISIMALGADDTLKMGRNTTANRPNPASVGQGAQFFDTTLNQPIWSNGTIWLDASGAAV